MSEETLAQSGLANAGNGRAVLDQFASVDARIDYLADDMRRGVWKLALGVVVGSIAPVVILLIANGLFTLPSIWTPSFLSPVIIGSIVLAVLHLVLDTRARQRQNKAELLLIKSDLLTARLAAGYPQHA